MKLETIDGVTYPVAEPSDFETHDGTPIQVFDLFEDEDGDRLYGYGHISEEDFLAEASRYLDHFVGEHDEVKGPVIHVYARFHDETAERFYWRGVSPDLPHSWPLTILQW